MALPPVPPCGAPELRPLITAVIHECQEFAVGDGSGIHEERRDLDPMLRLLIIGAGQAGAAPHGKRASGYEERLAGRRLVRSRWRSLFIHRFVGVLTMPVNGLQDLLMDLGFPAGGPQVQPSQGADLLCRVEGSAGKALHGGPAHSRQAQELPVQGGGIRRGLHGDRGLGLGVLE